MPKITLRKALNLKNRFTGDLHKLSMRLMAHNIAQKDVPNPYNTKSVLEEYRTLQNQLIELKTKIAKANVPIYEKIAKIAELKAEIEALNRIPTTGRIEVRSTKTGISVDVPFEPVLTQVEVDEAIRQCEDQIQNLNDEVDYYNGITKIDFGE